MLMSESTTTKFIILTVIVIFIAFLPGIVSTESLLSPSVSPGSHSIDSTIPELQNEDMDATTAVSTQTATPSQRALVSHTSSTDGNTVKNGILTNKKNQKNTTQTTGVVVNLKSAPKGIQKYALRITTDTNATITAIDPSFIDGRFFQVADGGTNETFAYLRGVDLLGTKRAFNDSKRLFTIFFDKRVKQESINISVSQLSNSDGEPISRDKITYVMMNSNSVFSDPIGDNPTIPTDPDSDGLYEDVDGNGELEIDDAVELALVSPESLNMKQTTAVDFNKNNNIGIFDVIYLFFEIMTKKLV